jgi:hypothetical protein
MKQKAMNRTLTAVFPLGIALGVLVSALASCTASPRDDLAHAPPRPPPKTAVA